MSVIAKMVGLLRSSLRDMEESLLSTQVLQQLETELSAGRQSLLQARNDLGALRAQELQLARELEGLRSSLAAEEALAVQALQAERADLAEPLMERVSQLELELAQQEKSLAELGLQSQRLMTHVQAAEARLRDQERELRMARTTESVQRATASIAETLNRPQATTARDALARIKQRSEALADRLDAQQQLARELGGLDQQLSEAGLGPDAERRRRVQERLRARAQQQPQPPQA